MHPHQAPLNPRVGEAACWWLGGVRMTPAGVLPLLSLALQGVEYYYTLHECNITDCLVYLLLYVLLVSAGLFNACLVVPLFHCSLVFPSGIVTGTRIY